MAVCHFAPTNTNFFDPLGFTAVGDERGFRKLRVSEIKHGRVARLHFELWKTSDLN